MMDSVSRNAEARGPASPADQNTSPRCLLLELPSELRLPIYEYLLKPCTLQVVSLCTEKVTGMASDDFATTCCLAKTVGKQLHPAVLRLCRQVYHECVPILLKPDKLLLQPSVAQWIDDSAHRAIDVRRLTGLHGIGHIEVELDTLSSSVAEDKAHSTLLAAILNPDNRVQELTLDIVEYSEENSDNDLADMADWQRLVKIWSFLAPSRSFTFNLCGSNPSRDYAYPEAEALASWHWGEAEEESEWTIINPRVFPDEARARQLLSIVAQAFPRPKKYFERDLQVL